jgi:hypothetical protein
MNSLKIIKKEISEEILCEKIWEDEMKPDMVNERDLKKNITTNSESEEIQDKNV